MSDLEEVHWPNWGHHRSPWEHGFSLYVASEEGGFTKVGVSAHPLRRIKDLQSANARKLRLEAIFAGERADCFEMEKIILQGLTHRRQCGEWLDIEPHRVVRTIKFLEGIGDEE